MSNSNHLFLSPYRHLQPVAVGKQKEPIPSEDTSSREYSCSNDIKSSTPFAGTRRDHIYIYSQVRTRPSGLKVDVYCRRIRDLCGHRDWRRLPRPHRWDVRLRPCESCVRDRARHVPRYAILGRRKRTPARWWEIGLLSFSPAPAGCV